MFGSSQPLSPFPFPLFTLSSLTDLQTQPDIGGHTATSGLPVLFLRPSGPPLRPGRARTTPVSRSGDETETSSCASGVRTRGPRPGWRSPAVRHRPCRGALRKRRVSQNLRMPLSSGPPLAGGQSPVGSGKPDPGVPDQTNNALVPWGKNGPGCPRSPRRSLLRDGLPCHHRRHPSAPPSVAPAIQPSVPVVVWSRPRGGCLSVSQSVSLSACQPASLPASQSVGCVRA